MLGKKEQDHEGSELGGLGDKLRSWRQCPCEHHIALVCKHG